MALVYRTLPDSIKHEYEELGLTVDDLVKKYKCGTKTLTKELRRLGAKMRKNNNLPNATGIEHLNVKMKRVRNITERHVFDKEARQPILSMIHFEDCHGITGYNNLMERLNKIEQIVDKHVKTNQTARQAILNIIRDEEV